MDIYLLARKWRVLLKKARMKQLQPNEYNSGIQHILCSIDISCSRKLCLPEELTVCRDVYTIQFGYVWGG
jgi:hypothetical protein